MSNILWDCIPAYILLLCMALYTKSSMEQESVISVSVAGGSTGCQFEGCGVWSCTGHCSCEKGCEEEGNCCPNYHSSCSKYKASHVELSQPNQPGWLADYTCTCILDTNTW